MPRPRTFDRDEVVQKAMHAFWSNGYEGTSINDLVEATGVARGSLYHEFRSKAGLFTAAMERYAEMAPATRMLGLADSGPPRETIERFFSDIVEFVTSDAGCRGCLFSEAICRAVLALYPARIAACVAFKSTKYSSTNRCCFGVIVLFRR